MSTIPAKESLTCEFKSDLKGLPDRDLIEAVVCTANGAGGEIYLGVEDDGQVTGLHIKHQFLDGLAAPIANRTQPALRVTVDGLQVAGLPVARISVPKSAQPVATSEGMLKRRRLQANGEPERVPYLPHEFASRQASFGLLDVSAQVVSGATLADLDPVERARLRQFIERFNGDRALLELDDIQLDAALGLTVRGEHGYTLSPELYRLLGEKAEYTRQAGFGRLQQEQMVRNYVAQHGRITRQEVIELCRLSPDQAYKLLKRLVIDKSITKQGDRRHSFYVKT